MKEYYNKDKLSLNFDGKKDGYWLGIGEINHFIDNRAYKDLSKLHGLDLFDRLKAYDDMILYNLKREKVLPSKLENMFSEVDKKLAEEFEEFKKANNL